MKTYRALKAFPHGNSYVDKAALVRLTDKQAAFLVPGGYVELVEIEADAPALVEAPEKDAEAKKGTKK